MSLYEGIDMAWAAWAHEPGFEQIFIDEYILPNVGNSALNNFPSDLPMAMALYVNTVYPSGYPARFSDIWTFSAAAVAGPDDLISLMSAFGWRWAASDFGIYDDVGINSERWREGT